MLPRSKYQSGVGAGGTNLEFAAQSTLPMTAATGDRRRKRTQNTSDLVHDRNHIIEMAQQIVLPPIRESDQSGAPTILAQQQQR